VHFEMQCIINQTHMTWP